MKKSLFLLGSLFFVACSGQTDLVPGVTTEGSGVTSTTTEATTMKLVATIDNLPKCTLSNQGQLVYVKAEENFYNCDNSNWSIADIKGDKGAKGEKGDQGLKGDKGDKGADGISGLAVQEIRHAYSTSTDLCSDGPTSTAYFYCYDKSIQLAKISDNLIFYSFVLYKVAIEAGDTDSDSITYSGFAEKEDDMFFIDLGLHDAAIGNKGYVSHFFLWDGTSNVAYLAADLNEDNNLAASEKVEEFNVYWFFGG